MPQSPVLDLLVFGLAIFATTGLALIIFPFAMAALNKVLNSFRLSLAILVASASTLVYWLLFEYQITLSPTAYAIVALLLAFLAGTELVGLSLGPLRVFSSLRHDHLAKSNQPRAEGRASLLHIRILLGFFYSLSCAIAIVSIEGEDQGVAAAYFLTSVLSAWGFTYVSDIHFDHDRVWRKHPWGVFSLRWDELTRVSMRSDAGCVVFFGSNKRLPILGPAYCRSAGAHRVSAFLDAQLDASGIIPTLEEKLRCGRAVNTRERT